MEAAKPPKNEAGRLKALLDYQILDTEPESAYDDLTLIASQICNTPISLVSLVDKDRQWFKSRVGLDAQETPRDLAFCAHAILQREIFLVEDTLKDKRFADNPLVTGAPHIRFYAGAPLVTWDGYSLGTLCVIDTQPRHLTLDQRTALLALARQVVTQLELRMHALRLERMKRLRDRLLTMISHDLRSSFSISIGFAQALKKRLDRLSANEIIECLDNIESGAQKANDQLDAMLEWSKQQMGDSQFSLEIINVKSCGELLLDQFKPLAKSKQLDLSLTCPSGLQIRANRVLFKSALQNLMSNAIKFSQPGGKVSLGAEETPDTVNIWVEDEGVGMDQKTLDNLFNEDERISTPGTRGETGTGLGSILVKDFVESAHGSLEVNSSPGKGTQVRFTVPKTQVAPTR